MRRDDLTKKKDNDKNRYKDKDKDIQRAIPETCDICSIWSEWWGDMTRPKRETITMTNTETKIMTKTNKFREHLPRAILENCEISDTDYNFDNWEPEFMASCVTWQLKEWHWTAFAILAMFDIEQLIYQTNLEGWMVGFGMVRSWDGSQLIGMNPNISSFYPKLIPTERCSTILP